MSTNSPADDMGCDIRMDVPQDQSYMNMSDPSGQMAPAANDDMVKAMLTPGGLLKKVADSTYDQAD